MSFTKKKKIISRQSKQQAKFYALKDPLLFYNIWNSFLIYMCTTVISTQVVIIPRHCRYDFQKNFCFSKIYHFEIIHPWHFDTYCGIFVLNQQFATFIFLSYENMIRPPPTRAIHIFTLANKPELRTNRYSLLVKDLTNACCTSMQPLLVRNKGVR